MTKLKVPRDRVATILLAIFLLTPGSPALLFDGLPLGRRVEVGALLVVLISVVSRSTRAATHRFLSVGNRRSAFILVVAALIFLKLFTFLRFPIGENFEVCLKSTYRPVVEACEKSFDYLFHSNDGVNAQGVITRVDSRIDFRTTTGNPNSTLGSSHSTWNLPFQNEFPRFSELWMNRLPFSAKVGAVFTAPLESLLPVEYVGDISIATESETVSATDYEFRKLLLVPIQPGRQELRIDYSFSDDDSFEVPDEAPQLRGPYAHLVIGAPFPRADIAPLQLTIRGWVVNVNDSRRIQAIEARNSGRSIPVSREERPDVAQFFGNARHLNGGFRSDIDSSTSDRQSETFLIYAILDSGEEVAVGEVQSPDWSSANLTPIVSLAKQSVLKVDVAAWYSLAENPDLLRAEHRIPPSLISKLLLVGLDMAHSVLILTCLIALCVQSLVKHRRNFCEALLLAAGVGTVIRLGYGFGARYIPWLPQSLTAIVLVLAPVVWLIYTKRSLTGLYVGVVATITSYFLAVPPFRSFTGLGGAEWWGFMIFRDRPMDWFVYQGYAYQILTQQSLRAGEDVLYFMPGARYIIFLSHILFGNNDVLIGIIVYAGLIGSALFAFQQLLASNVTDKATRVLTVGAGCVFLGVSYSSLSTQLSIASSSETFAWTIFFVVTGLMVRIASVLPTSRFLCVIGILLGSIVFIRPNYLMVSVCFLVACLILIKGKSKFSNQQSSLLLSGWLLFGFIIIFSLPLLHNVYYGETVNFFTNRSDPALTIFEPREILNFFGDSAIRTVVLQKFERFLYWQKPSRDSFLVTSWISQSLYIGAAGVAVKRRHNLPAAVAILLAPIAYVLSAAPFGITTIPERQFAMATLALAATSGLALIVSRNKPQQVKVAEEVPVIQPMSIISRELSS